MLWRALGGGIAILMPETEIEKAIERDEQYPQGN